MFKKMAMTGIAAVCVLAFSFPAQSFASSNVHTVQKGESLYKIASKHDVPTEQLKAMNDKANNELDPGEKLKLPVTPNATDKDLLSRLVEAEAKGESYAGKVAVATVVLNRVESDIFPDTIHGVVHDGYQFSPVLNGTIKEPAGEESKRAVEEALAYQGYDQESLYFYNPDKAESSYLSSKEVTTVIGHHVFLK